MLYTGVVLFVSHGKAHIFSQIAVSRIFAATKNALRPTTQVWFAQEVFSVTQ